MLEQRLREGGGLEVLQGVVGALARQYPDDEVLTAMSGIMLNYGASSPEWLPKWLYHGLPGNRYEILLRNTNGSCRRKF